MNAVNKLAEALRIPLDSRDAGNAYGWDGYSVATGRRGPSEVIHDLAHYLVTGKKRRKIPEFGLGPSPDGGPPGVVAPLAMPFNDANREEQRASLLGIAYEAALGMDFKRTLLEHSWVGWNEIDGDVDDFWRTVAWLRKKGLLDENGRPTKGL